ncbi:MAG: choice-of-anchor E domain-containing protein [Phycisphaerales bacterium]|jgi:hypothetical protein|nr:choice-of-anchor E domain-containing protein [Phycisphaerales bacterium]
MKINRLSGVAALAAASTFAAADITSETQNFSFPLSPGGTTLNFAQFDTLGGTRELCKVTFEFDATVQGQVTAENDSSLPAPNFGVQLTGFLTLDVGAPAVLSGFGGINEVASQGVGPSDGNTGSGPDFHDFGLLSDNISGMDMTTLLADFAQFIGGGTVPVAIAGSAGFSVSGTTDSSLDITNLGASGSVTITYEYKIVPAPASVALLGLGGLVAGRRRR